MDISIIAAVLPFPVKKQTPPPRCPFHSTVALSRLRGLEGGSFVVRTTPHGCAIFYERGEASCTIR
jgi:hypothetical protein